MMFLWAKPTNRAGRQACVAHVAEHMPCVCRRQGKEYKQSYASGEATGPLKHSALPSNGKKRTGTCIRFLHDRGVFAKK